MSADSARLVLATDLDGNALDRRVNITLTLNTGI